MQPFGNVATDPVRKESKSTGKCYFEMRVAESQRGVDTSPTFYTVRVMKDVELGLKKGDFVKVTHAWLAAFGKLRTRLERRIDIHVALLSLACSKHLRPTAFAVLLAALTEVQKLCKLWVLNGVDMLLSNKQNYRVDIPDTV